MLVHILRGLKTSVMATPASAFVSLLHFWVCRAVENMMYFTGGLVMVWQFCSLPVSARILFQYKF